MTAAHGALYVFYTIHLVAQGYSTTVIGLLWTLGVVAEIVVFLTMPGLSRRFGLRTMLLACFALAILRFTSIGWGVAFLGLLIAAQVLHGATFGAHHAASMAALNKWFSAGQQGHGQALYGSVAYGAGGLAGALLAGRLWSQFGAGVTFSAAALIALVGLLLVWRGVPGDVQQRAVR
jgi:PPP family 3-phenylpropionic acid transporter